MKAEPKYYYIFVQVLCKVVETSISGITKFFVQSVLELQVSIAESLISKNDVKQDFSKFLMCELGE